MRSISFPISLRQDFSMQWERILPFMLAGLLMLGCFLSSWTLQAYKPSHPSVKPPPFDDHRYQVYPIKQDILPPPRPDGGDLTSDPPTCQKPPKIQFGNDPTIKERVRGGINQWEQHPDVTGGLWGVIAASPLLLTSAPVIAVAAVGVVTWLFVRGALGGC